MDKFHVTVWMTARQSGRRNGTQFMYMRWSSQSYGVHRIEFENREELTERQTYTVHLKSIP